MLWDVGLAGLRTKETLHLADGLWDFLFITFLPNRQSVILVSISTFLCLSVSVSRYMFVAYLSNPYFD